VERILELVRTRIPRRYGLDPIATSRCLCPMQRGGVGRAGAQHRAAGGAQPAGEAKVERFGWTFAPGDKVMQLDNDYEREVFNGDVGTVAGLDAEAGELTVTFDGGRSPTASGSWTRWRRPMPSRSTRAREASTRPWSSRC
jgi:exodeoxyribonuclease V alpha subunit